MDPTKFDFTSFGLGGMVLGLLVWLIYTFVKERLPKLEARGDGAVATLVAELQKAREEERADRLQERKDASSQLALLMNQQIEERRRERSEFYAVLDRLDGTLVRLTIKIESVLPQEPDVVVSAGPNTKLLPAVKP